MIEKFTSDKAVRIFDYYHFIMQVSGEKDTAARATEQLEAQLKEAKANATSLESQLKEQRKDR